MKDMSIIANKKIINKETGEIRLVVSIDKENRKIHAVLVNEPNAEPKIMAAASYDRRWAIYEEPKTETAKPLVKPESTEPAPKPVKSSDAVIKLESLFDLLNSAYFNNMLPKPVITVQASKAYRHCATKKIWNGENDCSYEISINAELLNRSSASAAAAMCHEMIHLYCFVNELNDTCQKGRYHNKIFKAEAEARHLAVKYDRTVGFAHTTPTESFEKVLEENDFALETPFARVMFEEKVKIKRTKTRLYTCPVCGQTVKATTDLSLICGICKTDMAKAD